MTNKNTLGAITSYLQFIRYEAKSMQQDETVCQALSWRFGRANRAHLYEPFLLNAPVAREKRYHCKHTLHFLHLFLSLLSRSYGFPLICTSFILKKGTSFYLKKKIAEE